MKHLFKILIFIIFILLPQIPVSNALFNAQDIISNNMILTGNWETLDFYLTPDGHHVDFKVKGAGLADYNTLDYLITYDSDQTTQAIEGHKNINGLNEIAENNLLLGFTSSGGTEIYFTGVHDIKIKVTLKNSTETKTLESTI